MRVQLCISGIEKKGRVDFSSSVDWRKTSCLMNAVIIAGWKHQLYVPVPVFSLRATREICEIAMR